MKTWLTVCALGATLFARLPAQAEDTIRESVVRITATQRAPNLGQPWTKAAPKEVAGTGFVIEGQRILTNAHVVSYATQIYVEPHHSDNKIPAKVILVAPAIDLALLSVDEAGFFDKHPPVPLADDLPSVKQTVNVYGFPLGGEQISVTEGIVSRVEFAAYFQGCVGTRVQIDAALNRGNSGGPAVSDGRLVGVAFSGIPAAENIGFLIPTEEVRAFLADAADGVYTGKPRLRDHLQGVQNSALRAKLRLPSGTGGAMVQSTARKDDSYPLKPDDVITHIGEHALDSAGNVQVTPELQLAFLYYVPKLAHDGKLPLTRWRDGMSEQIELPLVAQEPRVISALDGAYPRYFIHGPLVFSPATQEMMSVIGERARMVLRELNSPLTLREADPPAFDGEELVILTSPLFAHPIAKGYQGSPGAVLRQLNGVDVKSLKHLVELLRDQDSEFVEFRFAGTMQETLVFRRTELDAATEDILSDNSIRKQCSDDLLPIWTARKSGGAEQGVQSK